MEAGLFFVLLPALIFGAWLLSSSQSQRILENWAARHRLRIVEQSYAWLGGPFWLRKGRGQTVYRVLVEDAGGRRRQGWVLCGSWWAGTWSDAATVRRDDE